MTDRAALIACVRDRPAQAAQQPALERHVRRHGVAGLAAAARRHGVTGCLWTALRAAGLTDAAGAGEVAAAHRASVATHLRTLADLELVDDVLRAAGIGYLVFKGPVLAEAVYPRPDLRGYVDLDVLVRPADFAASVASLERSGFVLYERNWPLVRQQLLGQLRLFAPDGTVLDLHWHLLNQPGLREAFPIDLGAVHARSRPVRVGERTVRTLHPADTLVHLALHAALAGGRRLVWVKDLEQVLLRPDAPSWPELAAVAARWRAGLAVALMLARARRTLAVPVPDEVLRELAPDRLWRAVTRTADAVAPVGGHPDRPSPARVVARAVRADGAASRRELAGRGFAWLRHAAAGRWAVDRLPDPADRRSAAYPAGGPAERSAYLDEVARQPAG